MGLAEAAGRGARGQNVDRQPRPRTAPPAAQDTRGLIKLVADARSDLLLGGQILAPEGAEVIQKLALAIKHRMTPGALAETLFPYLTTVEGLKLAALGFSTNITRLSCGAG